MSPWRISSTSQHPFIFFIIFPLQTKRKYLPPFLSCLSFCLSLVLARTQGHMRIWFVWTNKRFNQLKEARSQKKASCDYLLFFSFFFIHYVAGCECACKSSLKISCLDLVYYFFFCNIYWFSSPIMHLYLALYFIVLICKYIKFPLQ